MCSMIVNPSIYVCTYIIGKKGGENIQVNMLKFKQREPVRSYENLILCKYVLFVSKWFKIFIRWSKILFESFLFIPSVSTHVCFWWNRLNFTCLRTGLTCTGIQTNSVRFQLPCLQKIWCTGWWVYRLAEKTV